MVWFVTLRGLVSYVKASSWLCLQAHFSRVHAARSAVGLPAPSVSSSLQLAGCVVQAGSFVGSLGMFLLANVAHVFPTS